MCSHESIDWKITNNSITDRMIDISLIRKFRPPRKIRKTTKVLNAEIKKHCGVKDYKHYVELKTNVLRNLTDDTDTSDSSSLSDVDYDIIYSSPSKLAKYVAKNSERCIFTSDEDFGDNKRKTVKLKNRDRSKERSESRQTRKKFNNTDVVRQTRKSPRIGYKKCIDVGWQEVKNKSSSLLCSHKEIHINTLDNEENILKNNHSKALPSEQSVSSRFDSRNSTSPIKYGNKYTRQNHEKSNAMDNKLSSKDNTISKTKQNCERKTRKHENEDTTLNESNTKFNSHDSQSSQATNLENSTNFDSKPNTLIKFEDNNSSKLTAISNGSSMNTKNEANTYVSNKPELKNVRRNLITTLDKADTMNNNEDVRIDKNVEDRLNYDKLLSTVSFNQHSTPLKDVRINIPKIKDLSPDTSSLDQQKDSGIDDDSQDKVKIKKFNKIASNIKENADKVPISSSEPKKNDEVVETAEDHKKNEKDVHLKFSNDTLKNQTSKEEEIVSREEEIKSLQLNEIDINVDTNQEFKEDEHFTKTDYSSNSQKQLSSPGHDCNILHKRQANQEKEEKDFPQLNKEETQTGSINQEDQTCVELENTYDVQKQQILPKVMCTKILDKRYKIMSKKDSDNTTDNNNTNVANKYTPEKNTLIHRTDVIDHSIDNWEEATVSAEKIDLPITSETDNEEINMGYVSPQTKKRLQQQARLNLVVNSDSSESDDECVTRSRLRISQIYIDSSTENSKDDKLKNVEGNSSSKQTDISHSKDSNIPIEATAIFAKVVKLDSVNMEEETKKKESLTRCTYANNDSFQSTTDKNSLTKTQDCENVNNNQSKDDSFQLRVSEINSCNNEQSVDQAPLSNKKNMYTKRNEDEEIIRTEFETRYQSEREQNTQASTKAHSNIHPDTQFRPCNLQELIEDQELVVETMPASFTLAELSETEEAFFLSVPSKVLRSNLKDKILKLKENSIKFNENTYRIIRKEGTTSCIFATGKKRKPYKIINIKNISTISVREKLSQDSRETNVSNFYSAISPVSKPIKIDN